MENTSQQIRKHVGLMVFGVWCLTMIISYVGLFSNTVYHYHGTEGWTEVQGTILKATLLSSQDIDTKGNPETTYEPQFVYEWEIKGRKYTDTGFERDDVWKKAHDLKTPDASQQIVNQYPVGSEVTLLVNPHRKAQAVIFPDDGTSSLAEWIAVWFGLVVIIFIGVSFLLSGFIGFKKIDRSTVRKKEEVNVEEKKDQLTVKQNYTPVLMKQARVYLKMHLLFSTITLLSILFDYDLVFPFAWAMWAFYIYKMFSCQFGALPPHAIQGYITLNNHPLQPSQPIDIHLEFDPEMECNEGMGECPSEVRVTLCRKEKEIRSQKTLQEIEALRKSLDSLQGSANVKINGSFTLPDDIQTGDNDQYWEFMVTFPNSGRYKKTAMHFPVEIKEEGTETSESEKDQELLEKNEV